MQERFPCFAFLHDLCLACTIPVNHVKALCVLVCHAPIIMTVSVYRSIICWSTDAHTATKHRDWHVAMTWSQNQLGCHLVVVTRDSSGLHFCMLRQAEHLLLCIAQLKAAHHTCAPVSVHASASSHCSHVLTASPQPALLNKLCSIRMSHLSWRKEY